jgi:hypothetical protein
MAKAVTSYQSGNERELRLEPSRLERLPAAVPSGRGAGDQGAREAGNRLPARNAQASVGSVSVLFLRPDDAGRAADAKEPESFHDLNLDQIVASVTGPFEDYGLTSFFHAPLHDVDAILFRHGVFKDLQQSPIRAAVSAFAQQMRSVREKLERSQKLYYRSEKQAWFLDAVKLYCDAVDSFADALDAAAPRSQGLRNIRDHLETYRKSSAFGVLARDTAGLKKDLAALTYCMIIKDGSIIVRRCEREPDYSADVEATFAKFRQGAVKEYKKKSYERSALGHVEAGVVDRVALLYPALFGRLNEFCQANAGFIEERIGIYDREVQFYLSYLAYMTSFEEASLSFCYPEVLDHDKAVRAKASFDAALALKLIRDRAKVVPNDFHLEGEERIIVVSGPNQGGKTTFARTFGQLHYLAALGCPVPAAEARLYLFDKLLTHFEREEDIETLRGKLEDELFRIHAILEEATPRSIVVINEIFASTTLKDAIFLGRKIMEKIAALDLICVCVTFIDELASATPKTVSMMSTIVPENPAERTFKVVRKEADGLAYALALAEKYGVTYARLKGRIGS